MMPAQDRDVVLKTLTTRAAIALVGAAVLAPTLQGFESPEKTAEAPVVRTEMLVSTSWLQEHLADSDLVVLYIGQDRTRFDDGHIPGARFVRLDELVEQHKDSLNELPPVADLQALFQSLGVGDDSRVVLMGDHGGVFAARAYFTLDYLGHGDRAALLDGGLEKWAAEARPISRDNVHSTPAHFTPQVQPDVLIGTSEVRRLIMGSVNSGAAPYVLLDARPLNEFDGVVNSEAVAKAGHISGAGSLYWKKLIRSEADPALLNPSELEQQFRRAGLQQGQKVITYCRTGMQSSFTYFVAKYLGHPAAMYDGSIYEWVSSGNDLVVSPARTRMSLAHW
jgi:thiosulfate/3-mercaptopyruvate sulfurtransferase